MSAPVDAISHTVHPTVSDYLASLAGADDPLLDRLDAYAKERGFPLIGRQSGRWLELLTALVGGKRVFELGSGWGYSAFFFARAVGPEGEVIGSEKDSWELDAHETLFGSHPLKPRIRIHIGDGFEILDNQDGLFDVLFIDIDKAGYPDALTRAIPRVRAGGLILTDNSLWGGRVTQMDPDESTAAIRRYNRLIHSDPRLQSCILPVDDGLAVSRVREA